MGEMQIVFFGFLIHLIFLLSIFDIYFKSPIIKDIPVQYFNFDPPAKRLVLFVADGLRADSLFSINNNLYLSTYLRSVIETRGAWGIAHSRVPTESRPGHIALIAGFYEDPSAVFTGWKDNLVEFDSLFNRSYVTYSWGSPDILPMFKKGAAESKVHTFCYNAEAEDFSGQGSTKLNTWVFDRVEEFIKSAKVDEVLSQQLNSQGVVFFLHLLGPDVAGHSNKPHSRQYKDNINVIDEGIRKMEKILSEFYNNDNKTAFVYTSDHGMTDWGSHGAGTPHETEVPLVVWGAGAASPKTLANPHPITPSRWGLAHLHRRDVAQADISPLMATLIGVPIPVNSVGVLPLEYLGIPDSDKAAVMLLNARQLTAQLARKREMVETDMIQWLHTPFSHLTAEKDELLKQEITQLINNQKYSEAIEKSKELIRLSHLGLEYYHSYFQGLLLCCVSLSFFGWIGWLFCRLLRQTPDQSRKIDSKNSYPKRNVSIFLIVIFVVADSVTIYLVYVQSLPLQFHLYCSLPIFLWWTILQECQTISTLRNVKPLYVVGSAALYLILLELLVMTFFRRWILSLVVGFIGLWPFSLGDRRKLLPISLQICWLLLFLLLAVFPALPCVGHQTYLGLVLLCGGLWLIVGLGSLHFLRTKSGWVLPAQLSLLFIAVAVVWTTALDFDSGLGLRLFNQLAAWLLLVTSVAVPLLTDVQVSVRFLSIGLGLAVPFLLLCVGHEAFFLLTLFLSLCIWIVVEARLCQVQISKIKFEEDSESFQPLSADHFRKCFFLLMFLILSFFGTGNIASINSFDVSWVRCFLTVFSPFTMMTLILLKTLVPFLLVTCAFRAVNILSQMKAENMFLIVLIYCDIMGLHFLFAVTNKGSWLEIGTSVSHFVIMEVTVLFIAVLYYVSRLYTSTAFAKETPKTFPIAPIWMPTHKNHPD